MGFFINLGVGLIVLAMGLESVRAVVRHWEGFWELGVVSRPWEAVEESGSEALGTDLKVYGCVQAQGREHGGEGVRQRKSAPLTLSLHLPRPHTQALSLPAGPCQHHAAAHGNPHIPGLCAMERGQLDLLGTGCPLSSLIPFSPCCCCHQ